MFRPMHHDRQTKLLGHRGARAEAPENTVAGFNYARGLKIDGIELDVQLSADRRLVVFHDDSLMRCVGHQSYVDQLSTSKLRCHRQYRLVPLFNNSAFAAQPISTLGDVLPLLKSYNHIEIEIKTHARTTYKSLIDALKSALNKQVLNLTGVDPGTITLTSFDIRLLSMLGDAHDHLPFNRGLLVEKNDAQSLGAAKMIALTKRLGAIRTGLAESYYTQPVVDQFKSAGVLTTAWTVNDISRAQFLAKIGVNCIITDHPGYFSKFWPFNRSGH